MENSAKTVPSKRSTFQIKVRRRSITHGLALLPTFLYVIFVITYFEVSISDQEPINFGLKLGYVPFLTVRINYYLILLLHLLMLIGICWNSKYPELALNASFHLIYLAIASILVVYNYKSTLQHFEKRVATFNIRTPEERQVTKAQIEFLISFQKEHDCCGMSSYLDYTSENFDAKKAAPDDNTTCTFSLTWKQWLQEDSSVEKYMKEKMTWISSPIRKDLEASLTDSDCCKNNCSKGCKDAILKNLKQCTSTALIVNLYIVPWIVVIIGLMVCWSHLRLCQGTTWKNFGSYKDPELHRKKLEAEAQGN